jgi:hypothetical protein
VIGHLGTRVSALLDGQLSPADEERAWGHVHTCHQCRDAIEREGWVKTRLATMQLAGGSAPSHLKGTLLVGAMVDWGELAELADHPALVEAGQRRRHLGMAGIGGGAVGAAVMGVLALGASPANAPGAAVQPGAGSFGAALTHAITQVVEGQDVPPVTAEPRRTLAP